MAQSDELTGTDQIHLGELSGHPGWRVFVSLFETKVQELINQLGEKDDLSPTEAHAVYREIRNLRKIQQDILTLPPEMARIHDDFQPLR